uniref:Poly(ADP-ribose) glycohydrolase ARH3 n=1 Tax=Magallana gigas TaxID=29159 RepID=K1QBL9_MAGGI
MMTDLCVTPSALAPTVTPLPKGSEQRLKLHQSATARLGSACYVEGAMSSMLFLALEFADDVNAGLLANANCGGENCHRGAALGALLGASVGYKDCQISPEFKEGSRISIIGKSTRNIANLKKMGDKKT